jgi:glucoamylase
MEAYSSLSHKVQHTTNPSGSFNDNLRGLGEPKFNVDGSPYTENWGRPQRDGPALRAITLISWLRTVNASNPQLWFEFSSSRGSRNAFRHLYEATMPPVSVIKADLEYVSKSWNETDGFDLWEETQGKHFFTMMVQLRALKDGADIAARFDDHGAKDWYLQQAKSLEYALREFWDEQRSYLISTLGTKRSGLDCAILLGSIHGNDEVFSPWSDEVLLTLLEFTRDQRRRFPVNDPLFKRQEPQQVLSDAENPYSESEPFHGTGLGRYPEDTYDGYLTTTTGNPWFLCTSSASHILSLTASHLHATKSLNITSRGQAFWQSLIPSLPISPGIYDANNHTFQKAIDKLQQVSDEFLAVVRRHASAEGTMSEQFDGITGFERGARDLTWSYGAFLEAVRAREALGKS